MREALAFCVSMMLAGLLLAEARFGGRRSQTPRDTRSVKIVWASDREPSDDQHPPPPDEPGASSPVAGKPAPLQPRPGHHLVAANALPPGDGVYLLPKD